MSTGPWTHEDRVRLRRLIAGGYDAREIARNLGRTENAVRGYCSRQKIQLPGSNNRKGTPERDCMPFVIDESPLESGPIPKDDPRAEYEVVTRPNQIGRVDWAV